MDKWFRRGRQIPEREFIGEKSVSQQRLDDELDALLDQILNLFPPAPGAVAEIFVPVQGSEQLITSRIRPDDAVALPIRVHAGEGTIGTVFQQSKSFAGNTSAAERLPHFGSAGDVTHLLRTRSLLVIPLIEHNQSCGVLNIESPLEGVFNGASITAVQQSRAYQDLLKRVASMKVDVLSEDDIIRDLLDKLRQQVAFVIDPNDLASTYYQILQASAQIVNAPEISAGLVLVRDDALRLARVAGESQRDTKQLWAVLAAKLGAFNSDPEWKLEDASIAGRVVRTRKSENIRDVRGYPGYRNSGTGYAESSELIVPLVDGDHALGVIGLVSPRLNTFTDADRRHVEDVAKIAVYAIKRGEEIRVAKRSETQLRLASELNDDFKVFFPPNVEDIRDLNIRSERSRIYDKILGWAKHYTGSDYAAIVLPEILRDDTNTYLTVHRGVGDHLDTAPPRWLAQEGVTGKAYSSGQTAEEQEIAVASDNANFIQYYVDVRSEIAAPMKRGEEVIGVLDVESKTVRHFTTDHIRWVEFLAAQTALVLIAAELALKTQFELKMERLERETNKVSEVIRYIPLDQVRPHRDEQLRAILNGVREITGSSVGRILVAMNAYKSTQLGSGEDAVDTEHGVLYFMVSTDSSETASDAVRYFPINEGASGKAFMKQQEIIFRDKDSRQSAQFKVATRESLSGMIMPLYEGPRIVGVVAFEADRRDAYSPDYVALGRRAAAMISRLMVVGRLRISRTTTKMLRDFESSILQLDNKTIESFMSEVLQRTAELSDIKNGWGRLILLRPSTDPSTLIADRIFSAEYQDSRLRDFDSGVGDTREIIQSSEFREAITQQRPVLILDVSVADAVSNIGWPARSYICVPLLRPDEITRGASASTLPASNGRAIEDVNAERAIGLLVVASPNRSEFSEADKEILTPFTQTIVYGLQTLALLGSRQELMTELSHDFPKAYPSLQMSIRNVQGPLDAALRTQDVSSIHEYIQSVSGQIVHLKALVRLTQNMLGWFFDLARDDIRTDTTASDLSGEVPGDADEQDNPIDGEGLSSKQIFRDIEEPITTLAGLQREGYSVKWEYPDPPLYVATPRDEANLIAAVLFKFLDNAIKKTEKDDIMVTCRPGVSARNEPRVIFEVTNSGRPIDRQDRPLLFRLRFRPGSQHGSKSTGIGLYQAWLIAQKLGGDVGYTTDEVSRNTFWLSLPAAEVPADR